ncbi:hypothetical protein PSHT_08029 [Puccinia striiformis]|uniref:DDE Tnp4 domain-containing protein n=1 Tax=Puccinia striiformis TaxID=27350 RepID=A0A2S4VT34_9BASI|nr:hypothetical protein PSHT_08029 [Puccinia striiformis]
MAAPYQNRKGQLSQNVLGVVDFNMCFTYIVAGWEGCAHDANVLHHARTKDFKIPAGCFYLGDAGYGLGHGVLVPYRGVRYHLREQGPANPKELFNLCHATLWNVVERTFGAWKKRFPILTHALDYDLGTQQDLVFALAIIHNFSINHSGTSGDDFFDWEWDESMQSSGGDAGNEEPLEQEPVQISCRQKKLLAKWRDEIAQSLWQQYQEHLATQPSDLAPKRRRISLS